MSKNFWHPVARVQNLQISLLMLIRDFCPSPLHRGENFTSWALSREWLFWDVLKMHHFTQLGFTDNLELKEEDSNRNQPNTLLVAELRQLIGRQSSELREFFFFSIRLANRHWESIIAKIEYNAGKSQSKKVSCSMSCNCYLTDFKTIFETKPLMSCVRRVKYNFHFTRAGCVFSYVYFLLWCRMSGF